MEHFFELFILHRQSFRWMLSFNFNKCDLRISFLHFPDEFKLHFCWTSDRKKSALFVPLTIKNINILCRIFCELHGRGSP